MNLSIDGKSVGFSFKHANNSVAHIVMGFLQSNIAFVLHDGDGEGPVFIPEKLACIDRGQVLIHSGKSEFLFSLSFQMGLYESASELEKNELTFFENKLLL